MHEFDHTQEYSNRFIYDDALQARTLTEASTYTSKVVRYLVKRFDVSHEQARKVFLCNLGFWINSFVGTEARRAELMDLYGATHPLDCEACKDTDAAKQLTKPATANYMENI
jgi:hypothetical protein